ncbi:MAG: hypothetical protein HFK09_07300 [Clostridia bacterium]|nr:hypothetical protein [Clostridia bacterium]
MSDIKVFVYDTCGKKEEAVSAVEKAGMSLAEGNDEEALLAADFLLLSTADARELDEKEAADKWNFFLDELRWKRKENGEIIIIDCSELSFSPSRLAYGLKKCKRFRLAQIDEAMKYMLGSGKSGSAVGGYKPASSLKPAERVDLSEVVKPEEKEEKVRESGACKESHVFGEDTEREAEERKRAEARAKLDEIRAAKFENASPEVKRTIEEAQRRLEERRKAQEGDPRLNPVFDDEDRERREKYLKTAQIRSERSDNYNPFEGYPDYPKEDKPKQSSQFKSIGITIIIAAIILVLFMVVTSTIGMCAFWSEAFSVSAAASIKEESVSFVSSVIRAGFDILP